MIRKIGVLGHTGFVGKALLKLSMLFVPLTCDIRKSEQVRLVMEESKVDAVINLACISKVDFCEKKENQESVIEVNVRGSYNVCDEAERLGIPVILLSTDHVFSGGHSKTMMKTKRDPYGEKSVPNPINFYGMSKFGAEQMALTFDNAKIIRTSRLFDITSINFDTFYESSYPTFITRSFMYLPHFIKSIHEYVLNFDVMPKLLHISGTQSVSWYEFMLAIARKFNKDVYRLDARSGEMPDKFAPRPHYAGLKVGVSRKLGLPQFSYLDGISQMKEDTIISELIS